MAFHLYAFSYELLNMACDRMQHHKPANFKWIKQKIRKINGQSQRKFGSNFSFKRGIDMNLKYFFVV